MAALRGGCSRGTRAAMRAPAAAPGGAGCSTGALRQCFARASGPGRKRWCAHARGGTRAEAAAVAAPGVQAAKAMQQVSLKPKADGEASKLEDDETEEVRAAAAPCMGARPRQHAAPAPTPRSCSTTACAPCGALLPCTRSWTLPSTVRTASRPWWPRRPRASTHTPTSSTWVPAARVGPAWHAQGRVPQPMHADGSSGHHGGWVLPWPVAARRRLTRHAPLHVCAIAGEHGPVRVHCQVRGPGGGAASDRHHGVAGRCEQAGGGALQQPRDCVRARRWARTACGVQWTPGAPRVGCGWARAAAAVCARTRAARALTAPSSRCAPAAPLHHAPAGRITSKRANGAKLLFYDMAGDGKKVQIMADAR